MIFSKCSEWITLKKGMWPLFKLQISTHYTQFVPKKHVILPKFSCKKFRQWASSAVLPRGFVCGRCTFHQPPPPFRISLLSLRQHFVFVLCWIFQQWFQFALESWCPWSHISLFGSHHLIFHNDFLRLRTLKKYGLLFNFKSENFQAPCDPMNGNPSRNVPWKTMKISWEMPNFTWALVGTREYSVASRGDPWEFMGNDWLSHGDPWEISRFLVGTHAK